MSNNAGLKSVPPGAEGLTFTIIVAPNGEINIHGPLHDKVLCYGLLEIARDLVKDFKPQQVVVPKLVLPTNMKGDVR